MAGSPFFGAPPSLPSVVVFLVLGAATSVAAQQRPLVTEDPEVIGAGRLLIEAGVDVERDRFYPVSGLRGDRLVMPSFGLSIGLSSIAELQIDGAFYQRLTIQERVDAPLAHLVTATGDHTSDLDDFVLATKVRVLSETAERPAVAVRFATRLPNASNESGLGHDMTDFFASLLVAKTIQSVRVVGNGGVAILGDPTAPEPRQNDLLTYGVSVARALTDAVEVVGEMNGRLNLARGESHPGAESRSVLRVGGRYTHRTVRVDTGLLLGVTRSDPGVGFAVGFTWVFDAFSVP